MFSAFGPAGEVREAFDGFEPSGKPVRHFGARRAGTGLGWQQVKGKVLLLVVDIMQQLIIQQTAASVVVILLRHDGMTCFLHRIGLFFSYQLPSKAADD